MPTLGASHLATESWEIQRTNNFEFSVAGLDELLGAGSSRVVTLAVEGAFLPSEQSNVEQLNYGNMQVKVAGTTTYGNGTLTLKDAIQEDVEKIVTLWRKSVYNPDTDQVGLAVNYKMDARVTQYAPDGTLERVWKLKGCFPSSVQYGDVNYTSQGAKKTISVSIEYDKAVRID